MKNTSALTLFISLFFLFLSFSFPLSALEQKCNPRDTKVLLQIKAELGNPDYLASWDPNVDCCEWDSLECDSSPPYPITELNIYKANISAQIPAAIGDLQSLQRLMIKLNTNVTGTIPSSISNLSNLTELILSFNNLSGPIPTFLTKLKKLTLLELSSNAFTGSIPPEIPQLQNLKSLYLEGNKITGTIPESFTPNIQEINLADNHLKGTVPKSLGNLNLWYINLSGNRLRGDASFLFGNNKTQLFSIYISRNKFAFNFSKVEFPSLSDLDISNNKIFGSIPQQLADSYIETLNVSYNKLCGEIPQESHLQYFDISAYSHNRCLCGDPLPACK